MRQAGTTEAITSGELKDPTIITVPEGDQVRAVVIMSKGQIDQGIDYRRVRALFQDSAYASDTEALASLCEQSKIALAEMKADLEKKGFWEYTWLLAV